MNVKRGKHTRCIVCNKEIYLSPSRNPKKTYCSIKCKAINQRKSKVLVRCGQCGREKNVYPSIYKTRKRHFCDAKCFISFNKGENTYQWKGKRKTKAGYIVIRDYSGKRSSGYIYEHRLIMQNSLGRDLKKEECIHHINGIKDDNRIENLELVKSNTHAKLHHPYRDRDKFGRYL